MVQIDGRQLVVVQLQPLEMLQPRHINLLQLVAGQVKYFETETVGQHNAAEAVFIY